MKLKDVKVNQWVKLKKKYIGGSEEYFPTRCAQVISINRKDKNARLFIPGFSGHGPTGHEWHVQVKNFKLLVCPNERKV